MPRVPALVALLALLCLATWLSLRARRHVDEMMASISRETTATAFYLLALVGSGSSVLAHLEFAAAPSPLDWVSMFAGLKLLAAYGVCARHGMLKPR